MHDLQVRLPQWINDKKVTGNVFSEVMQNEQTRALVAGQKIDRVAAFLKWFKAGGPIMVLMALFTLWAIYLVIKKMIFYAILHRTDATFYRQILNKLEKKDVAGASKFASTQKGIVAKVAQVCLAHSQWSRDSAEKAVRELLLQQIPG